MDPALRELCEGPADDEVTAVAWLASDRPPPAAMRVVTRFGDVVTCRVPRGLIREVWADAAVRSLKAARPFTHDPDPLRDAPDGPDDGWGAPGQGGDGEGAGALQDVSPEAVATAAQARRPEGLTADGAGVVVGVIDWGLDFAHPSFLDAEGNSRVLALWDQSAEEGDTPYGYGRIRRRAELQEALQSERPYDALGYGPESPPGRGTHGTHVGSIAAGSAVDHDGEPLLSGVAPGAELIFVHLDSQGTRGRANLGDSVALIEALDFVRSEAGERPFVINLSVGSHGGPHNGLTLVERAIDALVQERPGRCVVQSTGNYFQARAHAAGQLRSGETRRLRWLTDSADLTPNELEVWYPGEDRFALSVQPPYPSEPIAVPLDADAPIEFRGARVGMAYHRARDPSDGSNHVDIFLYPEAPAGTWQVVLQGESVRDGRYHAWVERDAGCSQCQSRFHPDDADPHSTTGTICNGFGSIVVGAYDARSAACPLGHFSSSGPTRDGRAKPDLLAPGVGVVAARSAPDQARAGSALWIANSGTSMAAPHVTGTVACMLQVAPMLDASMVRELLLSACRPLGGDRDDGDRARAGHGYLDTERAVELAHARGQQSGEALAPQPVDTSAAPSPPEAETSRLVARAQPAEHTQPDAGPGAAPRPQPMPRSRPTLRSQPPLLPRSASQQQPGQLPQLARAAAPAAAVPLTPLQQAQELSLRIAPVAASLFDALVLHSPAAGGMAAELTVLALPGARPPRPLGPGDVIVRRALGEGGVASAHAPREQVAPGRLPLDTLVLTHARR